MKAYKVNLYEINDDAARRTLLNTLYFLYEKTAENVVDFARKSVGSYFGADCEVVDYDSIKLNECSVLGSECAGLDAEVVLRLYASSFSRCLEMANVRDE